jgi:Flp pilus assembly protein TadG
MEALARIILLARHGHQDRHGTAAVEFALVATAMFILLLGGYDVAHVLQIRLQLQQALRAGGQYAMAFPSQNGDAGSPNNGIILAVQQALPGLTGVNVSVPVMSPDPGQGPPYYMTLTASFPYSPFVILGPTIENSVSYVVRFQ